MNEVNIFRAHGDPGRDEVREVVITITTPCPTKETREAQAAFYASEGAALTEAIWSSCPGGTVDALLAALMVRRASLLTLAFREVTS